MINAGNNTQQRAGVYVRQPHGYRAFIPKPLPPNPPIKVSGSLQTLLSQADYALGRLDGAILTLPNPDLFVFMYVRKEAVLSSQIEGTQSSLQNLLAVEAQLFDPDTPGDVGEVINYVRAMNYGLERLATLPVSVRLILSHYFKQHRAEYYERLQAVRDLGDWEGWLEFFLRGVAEVSEEATRTAAAILRMREEFRAKITDHLGRAAANGQRVMERLFEQPIVTVAAVRDWLGITQAGANQIVTRLEGIGLLKEITGYARNRRFRFEPYLKLFEESEETKP